MDPSHWHNNLAFILFTSSPSRLRGLTLRAIPSISPTPNSVFCFTRFFTAPERCSIFPGKGSASSYSGSTDDKRPGEELSSPTFVWVDALFIVCRFNGRAFWSSQRCAVVDGSLGLSERIGNTLKKRTVIEGDNDEGRRHRYICRGANIVSPITNWGYLFRKIIRWGWLFWEFAITSGGRMPYLDVGPAPTAFFGTQRLFTSIFKYLSRDGGRSEENSEIRY